MIKIENTQNGFGVPNYYKKKKNQNLKEFQMACLHMLPYLDHRKFGRILKKCLYNKNISVLEKLQP